MERRGGETAALERELVRAILANEALIAVTGYDRAARTAVLDRAQALLGWQQCRTVRLRSPEGKPLDLQSAMNQVVGPGYGGADRVERFFDEIALPVEDEQHIVLMVDDAQRLTSDLLSYLALIGPTTVGQDLRLQVVFAGDPSMWDKLPRAGNLAADRIETRIVVGLDAPIGQPLPLIEPLPEPPPPRLLPKTPPRRVSPTDGHEGLRHRLAQRYRRRERSSRTHRCPGPPRRSPVSRRPTTPAISPISAPVVRCRTRPSHLAYIGGRRRWEIGKRRTGCRDCRRRWGVRTVRKYAVLDSTAATTPPRPPSGSA